jgi:hypothetical protein
MKFKSVIIFVLFLFIFGCKSSDYVEKYPTINYLEVKLKLDTLNAIMNKEGVYKPIFTNLKNGNKTHVFFGASHVRDTAHAQFKALINLFNSAKPQVAFNEGGQVKDSVSYITVNEAIEKDGETGLLKYLCNQSGIKMLNGDLETQVEFEGLLKQFPKDQVLLYLACERFLNPYRQGFLGKMPIEKALATDFIPYLQKYGFVLNPEEQRIDYIKKLYVKYFKKPFSLNDLVEVHDFYLNDKGLFGEIGRKSKDIRDQALLTKIDKALDQHDRVFVVFGGSHWVAVQPALKYIMAKKRK